MRSGGVFPYGEREIEHLKKRDKKLGAAIERIGMIERGVETDPFPALIMSVVGQQVSGKAADAIYARLAARAGGVTPEALAALGEDELRAEGLSRPKCRYVAGIAAAALSGALQLDALGEKPDAEVIEALVALPGVGVWTAEMFLLFTLLRPDVVSFGDLAIRRGMMRLYGKKTLSRDEFERYRRRYSPYGSVASLYLWEISH